MINSTRYSVTLLYEMDTIRRLLAVARVRTYARTRYIPGVIQQYRYTAHLCINITRTRRADPGWISYFGIGAFYTTAQSNYRVTTTPGFQPAFLLLVHLLTSCANLRLPICAAGALESCQAWWSSTLVQQEPSGEELQYEYGHDVVRHVLPSHSLPYDHSTKAAAPQQASSPSYF